MKKPLNHVTDHAVLRHLQRSHGIDVEGARAALSRKVEAAIEAGAVATVADGIRYVLVDGVLVSCVPVKSLPLRRGRLRRRRPVEAEEE